MDDLDDPTGLRMAFDSGLEEGLFDFFELAEGLGQESTFGGEGLPGLFFGALVAEL